MKAMKSESKEVFLVVLQKKDLFPRVATKGT